MLGATLFAGVTRVGFAEAQQSEPHSIELPADFAYPNGITHRPDKTFYIGSVTSGDILSIAPDGVIATVFRATDDVFAGTSLRFDPLTKLLWVASPDFLGEEVNGEIIRRPHRIAAIDISRSEVVWSSAMPEAGFANDIALDGRGGVYITDSVRDRVLHLKKPGAPFETVASDPLMAPGDLGPAGIAVAPNGDLIIGLYSDGALLRVKPGLDGTPIQVTPLPLARKLENPDGLTFASDGRLLVLEGAVQSGEGKLLAIDLSSQVPHTIHILMENLESPLNLTVIGNSVALTESRIRHLLVDDSSLTVPETFRVVKVPLGDKNARKPSQSRWIKSTPTDHP